MSRFSGRQFKGAQRQMRMEKRAEAEARQKAFVAREVALAKAIAAAMDAPASDEPFVGFDK